MSPSHFCKVLAELEIVMKNFKIFIIHVKYFFTGFSEHIHTLKICTLAITVHGSFLAKNKQHFD